MASQAKVIIKGQNNIGSAVKSAASDLSSLKASADKLGTALKSAFAVTAIVGSVKKLGDGLSQCFSEFETADRAYRQLSLTLGDDSSYKSMVATIGNLSKKTLSSKGDIEAMVSELSALGKSSKEVEKISKAAVYLSNVTGKDLSSSMTTLLGTYNGTTTQLKKLGLDVSNLTVQELAQGKAVDVVIGKFGELSEAMAQASSSQSLKNIKDTLGDIRQGIGQIVSTSIKPMLSSLEESLSSFQAGFQNAVNNICIMISNLPTVMEKVTGLIKGMFSSIFDWDGIKTMAESLMEYLLQSFSLLVTNIQNMLALFLDAIPSSVKALWEGISSYGMYIITNLCNDIGFNLTGLINSVGKWLTDSSIGKFIDNVVTDAVNGIRMVAALLKNVPQMFSIITSSVSTIVSNLFNDVRNGFSSTVSSIVSKLSELVSSINLPQRLEDFNTQIRNTFGNVSGWFKAIATTGKDVFRYIGDIMKATFSWDNIRDSAVGMVETFINFFIDKLNTLIEKTTGWLSFLGVETKRIEKVSLSEGRTANPYENIKGITVSENSYRNVDSQKKESVLAIKLSNLADSITKLSTGKESDWSDISRQFTELMSPVFEEYKKESSTIGQTLATWTQKSSSEYLKSSKESFSTIGDFLSSWAKDFSADNTGALSDIITTIGSTGEKLFGDDISSFTTWLDGFLKQQKESIASNTLSLGSNPSTSEAHTLTGGESKESPFSSLLSTLNTLISSLGVFGDIIMGMNPWVAVLKTILESFVSTIVPAVKAVMAPVMDALRAIGENLAMVLLPILDAIAPILEFVGRIISQAVAPVLQMLSPIIELVASLFTAMMPIIVLLGKAFTILMSPVQFVADLFSWLGSWLKYFGQCVGVAAWNITHWFNQRSMPSSPGAFSSDAFSGLGDRFASWDSLSASNSTATDAVSTSTAVSSAGYQGATQVTINIYQQAPVVGDGGMRAFARMIHDEFDSLSYYGITN